MDQRIQFIAALKDDPRCNFTRLCARFGISRAVGYALVKRYEAEGVAALENRRPVARSCPHRTSAEVEDLIVAYRKDHPHEGPKKILPRLQALHPKVTFPVVSTIGEILDRRGLIRPRRARLRVPPHPSPLEPCSAPNELWCVDFKGHFALGDKTRCHPLTITDAASRFLIKCEALPSEKDVLVMPHFERAFREFGLPTRIRSDNGNPFATRAIGGLSRVSVAWIRLGIAPERIEPGHPEQNPRHERMHRTLKQATTNPPALSMQEQQRVFDRFRADYNHHRPHEALGQTPPARHYEPSWRPFREPRDPEYGEGFETRRLDPQGRIQWKGHFVTLANVLARQTVGLRAIDDDEWEIYFGPLLIGYALLRERTLRIESMTGRPV